MKKRIKEPRQYAGKKKRGLAAMNASARETTHKTRGKKKRYTNGGKMPKLKKDRMYRHGKKRGIHAMHRSALETAHKSKGGRKKAR